MKILRPNRVVKSAIFSLAFLSLFFFNSCKKLVDSVDEPYIPGASSGGSRSIVAPSEPTATQGAKQKITLSWDKVDGAVYYHIYYADNANDQFIKLDGTEKNFYEDKVGSGATVYYRIVAEKSDGELSEFSKTIKGTSLAVPTICDGVFEQNEATIYWYMQNSRDERSGADNYEANLQFIVTCSKTDGTVVDEQQLNGYQDHCTFTNLETNCVYYYSVSAFLLSAQTETENSPVVDATTLLAYTPQQPEFTVSQGTSSKGIWLTITLPPKVQVDTTTTGSPTDKIAVDYPLYFEIQRRLMDGQDDSAFEKIADVYYTGKVGTPTEDDYRNSPYMAGSDIKWLDTNALSRGVKYCYRIKSYTDVNYSAVIGSTYKETKYSKITTPTPPATWPYGWVSAPLKFSTYHKDDPNYEENAEKTEITKIWFDFSAEWPEVNKANYKFAVREICKDIDKNTEIVSDTWLLNGNSNLFDSIEQINNFRKMFEGDDVKDKTGYYYYTMYIIPATEKTATYDENKILDSVSASGNEAVSHKIERAISEITETKDGYKDKIIIKYDTAKNISNGWNVIYQLERSDKTEKITLDGSGEYIDTDVTAGTEYEYVLHARVVIDVTSAEKPTLRTLGNPAPTFNASSGLAYDSITVTMPETMAAKSYEGKFGDVEFGFNSDGTKTKGDSITVTKVDTNFTIKIDNPNGYNDVTKAGKPVKFEITAKGADTESAPNVKDNISEIGKVDDAKVLGPAQIGLQGTAETGIQKDFIKVNWKKIEGAAGYAVIRDEPAFGGVAAKTSVYFVDGNTGDVTTPSGKNAAAAKADISDEAMITLTDTQTTPAGETSWEINQGRIAWGLNYTYRVFPILAEGDKDSIEGKYTNPNADGLKKDGYTYGYGFNIKATKAEHPDKIVLTWQRPESSLKGSRTPTIYYHNPYDADSTGWTKADLSLVAESVSCSFAVEKLKTMGTSRMPDYRASRLNFIVDYDPNSSYTNLDKTYQDYLKKQNDGEELAYCGYAFTMPSDVVPATSREGYTESFTESIDWKLYGATANNERKKGPGDNMTGNPYTLYIKNLNNSSEWWPVATFDKDGNMTVISDYTWYSVDVANTPPSTGAYNVKTTITPTDVGKNTTTRMFRDSGITENKVTKPIHTENVYAGTHNGLLKVQRDYKHYYRIGAKRKVDSSSAAIETFTDEIVTYRKITDDEFVKGITMIIADAIWQAGVPGGSTSSDKEGDCGNFHIKHPSSTKTIKWGTNAKDYTHVFTGGNVGNKTTKDNDAPFTSAWTINMATSEARSAVDSGNLCYLPWGTIKVTHETGLASYKGYVIFRVGKAGKEGLTVLSDGVTKTWDVSVKYSHKTSAAPDNSEAIILNALSDHQGETVFNSSLENYYTVGGNETNFYVWFPYQLEWGKTLVKTYDDKVPIYKNDWWLDRGKPQ